MAIKNSGKENQPAPSEKSPDNTPELLAEIRGPGISPTLVSLALKNLFLKSLTSSNIYSGRKMNGSSSR